MCWERARSDEQKEQRVAEIIAATARLYEQNSYEEISFAMIAKEANFTRSNLYKYFNSKEEVFLELLKYDTGLWSQELVQQYDPEKKYNITEFAQIWASSLVKHKRLLELTSIVYTFLEKKSSAENLIEYKRSIINYIQPALHLFNIIFPQLSSEQIIQFLLLQNALASGLYAMANLHEVQKEVMSRAEFSALRIDFGTAYQNGIEYLLHGMM